MKLSTRARYALRLMLDLARFGPEEGPVSLAAISSRTGLSRAYLEQLASSLRTARLVRGVCGKQGGYQLTRDPSDITVADIIEAAIGPINIVDCLDTPEDCMVAAYCECRLVYALINHRISEVLEGFSLADLLDPGRLSHLTKQVAGFDSFTASGAVTVAERRAAATKAKSRPDR